MAADGLLAVDCSLRLTGVALAHEGHAVASETLDLGRRQGAELPLMAERLLREAGWTWDDIGRVAVTSGPGYFTGIRVGAAYASALAYGLGAQIGMVWSFALVAGIYLALLVLLLAKRRQWIEKPLVRFLADLFLNN